MLLKRRSDSAQIKYYPMAFWAVMTTILQPTLGRGRFPTTPTAILAYCTKCRGVAVPLWKDAYQGFETLTPDYLKKPRFVKQNFFIREAIELAFFMVLR